MSYLENGTLEKTLFMNDKEKSFINGVFFQVHLYKVCFQMGKSVKKKYQKVQNGFQKADNAENTIFWWVFKFKSSVISVEDAGQLGHPLTSKTDENTDHMKKLVHENR